MIKSQLTDGLGLAYRAQVNQQNELVVAQGYGVPLPVGTPSRYRYFNALLGSTGADSGTTNMNENGSVTNKLYYIAANPSYDIHIMHVSILIQDTAAAHGKYGSVAALTNGVSLYATENGVIDYFIQAAKTGGDVILQSGFYITQGDGAVSFEITDITGTEDATIVGIPIGHYIPGGLRLGMGTQDTLTFKVADDVTGLTLHNCRAIGFRHYPP